MTWVRLDDGFAAHPKVVGLDDRAFRLHICALCYAGQHLTDGAITSQSLRFVGELAQISYPGAIAKRLVSAGLWDAIEDGYEIHDYLRYNSAKADVERERAAARDRMARRRGANVQPNGSPEGSGERSGTPSHDSKERPSTSREPSRARATRTSGFCRAASSKT